MPKRWIAGAIKPEHEGELRDYFGVKEGEKIPAERLNALIEKLRGIENKTEKQTRLLRQANLAKTLRKL